MVFPADFGRFSLSTEFSDNKAVWGFQLSKQAGLPIWKERFDKHILPRLRQTISKMTAIIYSMQIGVCVLPSIKSFSSIITAIGSFCSWSDGLIFSVGTPAHKVL
ncbi:hypothetical protein BaRGS_00004575 [Batillaria attramentaria]|uniref:Uncharacterized protein n=1 Tax=Batillaria attramentaria TaxID=370345 RepID=A0ABD0LYM1_9CAEN